MGTIAVQQLSTVPSKMGYPLPPPPIPQQEVDITQHVFRWYFNVFRPEVDITQIVIFIPATALDSHF